MSLLKKLLVSEPLLKSSQGLLTFRLWFFGIAWVHLTVAAVLILPIDMSDSEDPYIRVYSQLKWRFITAWFNCIDLVYFPLCLYCDWREKRNEGDLKHVGLLRRIRDLLFTCILFPSIVYADLLFWRLYTKDPSLIAPPALFAYLPSWGQHSLHTISLLTAVVDLLVIPRRRPKRIWPRFLVLASFIMLYAMAVVESCVRMHCAYRMLEIFTMTQNVLFVLHGYVEGTLYFLLQWIVIEPLWGKQKSQ